MKSVRQVLNVAKRLITCSLKSFISAIIKFSINIIARAVNFSFAMVLRKKVLILFKVEKHLSAPAVVIGVVIKMVNSLTVSENVDCK